MSNQSNDKNNNSDADKVESKLKLQIDKTTFGTLAPLTAAQVVGLLISSDVALGACACGGPCGGPCY
jgi:hypothetical protein